MLASLACGLLPAVARSQLLLQAGLSAAACSQSRAFSEAAASTSQPAGLPFALPEHEIEDGLPVINARLRDGDGSNYCAKLRRRGRTPGVLFSLPGEANLNVDMDKNEAAGHVRRFGRNGILARVMRLELADGEGRPLGSVRVLPKMVHVNSVTLAPENLRLMYFPLDRKTLVEVPVSLWGEEAAPGTKAGGWLSMVNRTVPFLCAGWAVPPVVELDVRQMKVADIIRYKDVPVPEGCVLKVKDPIQPVVRCAVRVGGE